jgi:hypothetical protein
MANLGLMEIGNIDDATGEVNTGTKLVDSDGKFPPSIE